MRSLITRLQNTFLRVGIFLSTSKSDLSIDYFLSIIWPTKTSTDLIRVGSPSNSDGSYLIPVDLEGIGRVFSPGVADSMEFEKYFLGRGIPCEMIDGSVDAPPEVHPLATFEKLWLASENSPGHITLDSWVKAKSESSEDLLLQMDIEGAEYETLLSTSRDTLGRFRIIVLELHDLRSVFSRSGSILFRLLIQKLNETHLIVHAHPNNCCRSVSLDGAVWPEVIELTLHRRDRIGATYGPAELPHPLDRDNTHNKSLVLKMKEIQS